MAKFYQNLLFRGATGSLGKLFVLRQYKGRTILAKYPEKSKHQPSPLERENRERFKKAVAYAQKIHRDEKLSGLYKKKLKKGQTVFQYAISEYMKKIKEEEKFIELNLRSKPPGKAAKSKRK